jgi:hypothetical protein
MIALLLANGAVNLAIILAILGTASLRSRSLAARRGQI